jgi:uncharacterized membrane protein
MLARLFRARTTQQDSWGIMDVNQQVLDRTHTVRRRVRQPLTLPMGLAAMTVLVSAVAGYIAGRHQSEMNEATVSCLSTAGTISCGLVGSPGHAEYAVPRDVAWTQYGVFHEDGRPDCLSPPGRGAVTVRVTWTEVDVDGTRWKQVVGVHC